MSSLARRGENCPVAIGGAHWSSEVHHHCEPVGFSSNINKEEYACHPKRPSPEGAGGSRGDPHRTMCQRTFGVQSYKSLPGSIRERISNMSHSTLYRGTMTGSPGFTRSERKVACCEKCSATLVALKKQALSLSVHHHFSCKDSGTLSAFLHENLRVHSSRSTAESKERERDQGECGACGASLNQLKQEAVHLALSRGQASVRPPFETSRSTGSLLGESDAKPGARPHQSSTLTHSSQSPRMPQSPRTTQRTPQTLRRRGCRLPNPDMGRWVEEQQQLVASASKSMTKADGVITFPHREAVDDVHRNAGTVQTGSKIPHFCRVVTIANSAAMSFLARAAQKLNLTSRKKCLASDRAPAHSSTCFREIVQKNPPPVPSYLLQAAARTKDSPNIGKVKVVLRVNPTFSEDHARTPVLQIDLCRKKVTVMEPVYKSHPAYAMVSPGREAKAHLKTYAFDTAYPQESSQTEVCASVLADVIRCVVNGSDGCVLGLGSTDVGSWSSMVGSGENHQRLGLIPCAISWLYSVIERRAEKTWTTMNVSVSAIELCCGQEDTLRDLLGESVPTLGNLTDSPAAQVTIRDDPVYGIQLRNHNRVKAPTAERAASLLDVAVAARRHGDIMTPVSHSSIMFFTLHVQPPLTECSTIGKVSRSATKLTMIDVCSSTRAMSQTREIKHKRPFSELIPVVLALLSGHKSIPSRGSKLTLLLRDSVGHVNCHTTVLAQVDTAAHQQEILSTIQLASRIRRTQKRTKESTSCSPSGRSLCKEKRGHNSLTLRAFHSTGEMDVDVPRFRLRGEQDEYSSSDQSCDTVIQIDSDGSVQPRMSSQPTQPEFVPIIPSLHPIKPQLDDPEFSSLLQELLRIPQLQGERRSDANLQGSSEVQGTRQTERDCLKCETFAELQERLGCIDGSEITLDMLRYSAKSASGSITPKSPRKKTGKQGNAESSESTQTLMKSKGNNQTYVGQQQQDNTCAAENFEREDSGLYDCEECSAASSGEELQNQTHTGNVNGHVSHSDVETPKSAKRTSPVGKSSPISPSSSHSEAASAPRGNILPTLVTEQDKEMKATITVTVQQPLDLRGQDELVFSMVEEVTISGAMEKARTGGNIICIRDMAQSSAHVQASANSQPIRIISNVAEESATEPPKKEPTSLTSPKEANGQKSQHQIRKEMHFVPSFINPMLMKTDMRCDLDNVNLKENMDESTPTTSKKESKVKCPHKATSLDAEGTAVTTEAHARNRDSTSSSLHSQISTETQVFDDAAFYDDTVQNKSCGKIPDNTDKPHPTAKDCVYFNDTQGVLAGSERGCRGVGNTPEKISASSGCQETAPVCFKTASLPRGWHNANRQEHYFPDPRGMTSSTPCSPGITPEKRQGRHHSSANHIHHISSPRKYSVEYKHTACAPPTRGVGSLFETSVLSLKYDMSGRQGPPIEGSSRLFSTKLEQLTSRTNSLERAKGEVQTLRRGGSSTSVSSRGSSKGSIDGKCKAHSKGRHEGDSTLPRVSRSPKKNPRSVPLANQNYSHVPQTLSYSHSKLSAVGKLKMATPKIRRSSAPSTKNLSFSPKGLQQSLSRSASLSPEGRNGSLERIASLPPSSPPRSIHSISRTPSQSSTSSSTKSAIQGFVNGRITDLLEESATSPTSDSMEQIITYPSPYSQVTAPRTPAHMSGHASDTTSVLSGDLPPAMGKTSLVFSNRNSTVSSGYDSMLRDSEATISSTSNRGSGSVSDRSGSLLSLACSSRTSRRRGHTGSHHRRLSHDSTMSMRRSASGLRTRLVDRGIQEPYAIKVYEIDDVERMQKRAGAGKQRPACFSAKLKFLEHRRQRIAEVCAKYNNLQRELEQAKQNLMLEPTKWDQEVDLWQTFEVDSLEHLEALREVTARLESRVNLCQANVMMVTCFDASARRQHKRRRRVERTYRNSR